MDVSGLKKLYLVGPHASAILNYVTTRDVTKIYPGKCAYACMLNEAGHFIEDCVLYRLAPNAWMVVHGSGAGHETLTGYVVGRNAAMIVDDDLHDLSLQGPLAVDFLAKHVPGIRSLKYFHHTPATLFGKPVTISRTGYTGERGYEIFCKGEDAGLIWDTILSEGKPMGIIPACFTTLDWVRVESYLLFYPYDMSEMYPFEHDPPGDSLWELGLDFTVSPGQERFPRRGCARAPQGQGALQDLRAAGGGQGARGYGRSGLLRRQEGRRRHLRHGIEPYRQIDGDRAPRRPGRGSRHQARNSRQERQGSRDRAHIAVRRSGKEEAHCGGLSAPPWAEEAACKPSS